MEEARDQDEEILFGLASADKAPVITRDHAGLRRARPSASFPHFLAHPRRRPAAGALLLERTSPPFTEADALALRVVADQVARRLGDLHKLDRWFGARWAASFREWCSGFSRSAAYLAQGGSALAGCLLLTLATFVPLPYRVDATFILRPDAVLRVFVPAPLWTAIWRP